MSPSLRSASENGNTTFPGGSSSTLSTSTSSILNSTQPSNVTSQGLDDHDHNRTVISTLVVTMTVPLGTTTAGTIEWSTMLQTDLTVQLVLPSDFSGTNLSNSNHGTNKSAIIGIVFGAVSLVLLLLAGMFVILRRHFKKKYSEGRLARSLRFNTQQAGEGPYTAQAGMSHLRREDLESSSSEHLSEETATAVPIMDYREGRRSPVEIPRLYTDGLSSMSTSSFATLSSVPVPFYQLIKEARRAGIRKYTM